MDEKIIHSSENGADHFLINPPSQPKNDIADYVEKHGILVPKRFQGLGQALEHVALGGEIMVRSEHPQEYSGASGLLASYTVNKEVIDKGREHVRVHGDTIDWEKMLNSNDMNAVWDVQDQIFGKLGRSTQSDFEENLKKLSEKDARYYCELLGLNYEDFKNGISYSYWEKIKGFNRSIVADSAIPNRYHIFTTNTGSTFFHNYLILDNGRFILNSPVGITEEMQRSLPDVLEFYEKIRRLDRFDPSHCPIIEFQTDNEQQNYFLQYHRTRQVKPATFILDRDLQDGEFEVVYVRGSTPPEGVIVHAAMYYPEYRVTEEESASFDFHYEFIFSEIMSRRRFANLSNHSSYDLAIACMDAHLPKSRLFNPEITISIPRSKISDGLVESIYKETVETNKTARIPVRIISDGRRAYVRFEKEIEF